jgi:signal transduction histidine kinase
MTTYRIIQAMNGTISVDSELGKGTVFVVTLPRSS